MPIKIFCCYAHEDEVLLNKLKAHLRPLQQQGLVDVWHDRNISPGAEWKLEINKHLNEADIILLLISPDFMNSDYCYGIEMKKALERHERCEAYVIPVILRHIYWQNALGKLQALPTDAKPVTDPFWHNLDMAFYNVTEGIYKTIEEIRKKQLQIVPENDGKPSTVSPDLTSSSDHLLQVDTDTDVTSNHFEEFFYKNGIKTQGPVTATISQDGQLLAYGDGDCYISIWKVNKFFPWEMRHTSSKHGQIITSLAMSPDGKIIASGSGDRTVKIWDVDTGKLLHTFEGHSAKVFSVAISFDGKILASGSGDKTVQVLGLQTRELIHTLKGHTDEVTNVAMSPDGKIIASGSGDRTVKIWDVDTGKLLYTFEEHSSTNPIAISPDGQILAGCKDSKHIILRHIQTRKLLGTIEFPGIGRLTNITSIVFGPDGDTLFVGFTDNKVRIWHIRSGKLLQILGYAGFLKAVSSLALSANGQTLVSGHEGGLMNSSDEVNIWEKRTSPKAI